MECARNFLKFVWGNVKMKGEWKWNRQSDRHQMSGKRRKTLQTDVRNAERKKPDVIWQKRQRRKPLSASPHGRRERDADSIRGEWTEASDSIRMERTLVSVQMSFGRNKHRLYFCFLFRYGIGLDGTTTTCVAKTH